ncbi:Uncharacterized protein HZ326_31829, partial [Fusarium oxysporum f. sp. albedinis]
PVHPPTPHTTTPSTRHYNKPLHSLL